MSLPLYALSEPVSLVCGGAGFLLLGKLIRVATREKNEVAARPRPVAGLAVLTLVILTSVLATSCGRDAEKSNRAFLASGGEPFRPAIPRVVRRATSWTRPVVRSQILRTSSRGSTRITAAI